MAGRSLKEERDGYYIMPGEGMMTRIHPPSVNVKDLIDKIDEISTTQIDKVLYEAERIFKSLCVDQESMKEVMLNLHWKAQSDPKFGEKYVMLLGQVANYVVDNVPVRSELLTFIENDFKIKDTMFQSDSVKFINAAMLLGNVYNIIKIQGVPLKVLAGPMLEYLSLLLKGKEEHHKVFAILILLNAEKIVKTSNLVSGYEALKHSIRKTLIMQDLSTKSKCWILLALDFMANNLKPLDGDLQAFYLENLGEDYIYVHSLLTHPNPFDTTSDKSGTVDSTNKDNDDVFKDIENLVIPPEMLNVVSTRYKPRSYKQNFGSRMRNSKDKEFKNLYEPESTVPNLGNCDEDDMYGIQIEKEKLQKNIDKRN